MLRGIQGGFNPQFNKLQSFDKPPQQPKSEEKEQSRVEKVEKPMGEMNERDYEGEKRKEQEQKLASLIDNAEQTTQARLSEIRNTLGIVNPQQNAFQANQAEVSASQKNTQEQEDLKKSLQAQMYNFRKRF